VRASGFRWIAHPSAGTISLALIRYLAGGPGHRIGSIFFNPGGPGAPPASTR
jgi:hypothetical protein